MVGYEPVTVSTESSLDGANIIMGWLVGRAIASQRMIQTQDPVVPMGVLISSDGFMLCDSNGLYLIAKEDS